MDIEETSSVAKGVFVFKKNTASSVTFKNKNKQPWMKEPWYKAYSCAWGIVEQQVKELYAHLFSKLLTDVSTYFNKESNLNCKFVEIPTALILTGINLPDHSVLFSSLRQTLVENVTPHVVLLPSHLCPKVRTMTGHILRQCQKETMIETSFVDDEDDLGVHNVCKKVTPCTFSDLAVWYSNQVDENKKPIIIILSDFEGFQSKVVEDFIYIASEYWKQVPIYLVFGVATCMSAVNALLPHRVMSFLRMKTFVTEKSNVLLNQLIDRVILSQECYFRLGGSIFALLSDNFLIYDFSIQSFLQKFKYCMLTHYKKYNIPVLHWTDYEVRKWIDNLNRFDCEKLIMDLPSFREYVRGQSPMKIQALLNNTEYTKSKCGELIASFMKKYMDFIVGLKCLHELSHDLPNAPLGRYLGDLYLRAASSPIKNSEDFRKCEELWRNLSKSGLELHISKILCILKNNFDGDDDDAEIWINKLSEAKKKLHDLDNSENICPSSPSKVAKMQELKDASSRFELKEKLKKMAQDGPSLNRFEKLRNNILEMLVDMLGGGRGSLLIPPNTLPLHEIMLCEEFNAAMKNAIVGSSRADLHAALANPWSVLKCGCCKISDNGDVLPTMPDVCIAYKLHLECGKHINLYDWMQSFNQVLKTTPDQEGQSEDDEEAIDTKTQSRFTQAVAELQFLGFIKPTTRKADHVMRLTYGHS